MMKMENRNFKENIRIHFLKYAFIPIAILYILFFVFMIFITKYDTIKDTKKAGELVGAEILNVYNNYYEEIDRMAKSKNTINFVENRIHSNLVYEEFYKFNNGQKVKSAFHIIDKNGVLIAYTTPSDPIVDIVFTKEIIPRINKEPSKTLTESNKVRFSHDRYTVYTFGKAIYKKNDIIGYVIYQLYEEDIQNLIFVDKAQLVVVIDKYDRIISTTNNIVKGLMNKFSPQYISDEYVRIKDGKYFIHKKDLYPSDLSIYTLNSTGYNRDLFLIYLVFTLIISYLLYLLIRYLADKMSYQNTKSIDKLLDSFSQLQEGNMNSYVEINTGDEFEILSKKYNIMLDRLNLLIKKNIELSNIRRIKEVKQLQAQFNPHFMFNILETLRYAIFIDTNQAQDIIMGLSRLLRYSIKNEESNVLLEVDLDYIEDYLNLHKIRFKNRLTYIIDVPENIKKTSVPKLLIQPIIENSIKYGYRKKDNLNIEIKAYIADRSLILEVKDNGTGIKEEELYFIRNILKESKNMAEHIGLYNVHRRIVLLYGEDYGLHIESIYEKETLVRLIIPYKED